MAEILSTKSITKTFPGVKALDDVSVSLKTGWIFEVSTSDRRCITVSRGREMG